MNTLTKTEREVSLISYIMLVFRHCIEDMIRVTKLKFFLIDIMRVFQGIWVPKLVFSNTEEKDNTLNDDKAFTVARSQTKNEN